MVMLLVVPGVLKEEDVLSGGVLPDDGVTAGLVGEVDGLVGVPDGNVGVPEEKDVLISIGSVRMLPDELVSEDDGLDGVPD